MVLKGKTAIVTGASDGLGRIVSLKLAKEGVSLALIARSKERLTEVKTEAISLGSPKVEIYPCDISNKSDVEETMEKIESDFGGYQMLLNIAGVWQKLNQLDQISDEDIDRVIDTNLKGLVRITRLALPVLRKQEDAIIFNDASHSGVAAKSGQSVYSASKWGVAGFTAVLKEDLKGSNVRVAGLYQGGTQTKLFEKANDPKNPEDFAKFTKPEDLADVIIFMLSRPPQIGLYDVRVEY